MLTLKTRKWGAGSTFRERLSEIKVAYQVSKQMKSERWFMWGWARETATDKLQGASHEHVAVIRCERLAIFRRPGLHWICGTAISFIFISLVMHRFLQGWVWKAKYSRTTADFLTAPSELPHPTPPHPRRTAVPRLWFSQQCCSFCLQNKTKACLRFLTGQTSQIDHIAMFWLT